MSLCYLYSYFNFLTLFQNFRDKPLNINDRGRGEFNYLVALPKITFEMNIFLVAILDLVKNDKKFNVLGQLQFNDKIVLFIKKGCRVLRIPEHWHTFHIPDLDNKLFKKCKQLFCSYTVLTCLFQHKLPLKQCTAQLP